MLIFLVIFLLIFFDRLTRIDLIYYCFNIFLKKNILNFCIFLMFKLYLDLLSWLGHRFNLHIIFTRKIIAIPKYLFGILKKINSTINITYNMNNQFSKSLCSERIFLFFSWLLSRSFRENNKNLKIVLSKFIEYFEI